VIHFERWSLLIIGEALKRDATPFRDFEKNLDIAGHTLSARLDQLVRSGLLEIDAPGAAEPLYSLTEKGRDLGDVIAALDAWSERWALTVPLPATLTVHEGMDDGGDATAPPEPALIEIGLMGAFVLRVAGRPVDGLSIGSQRLLVFLALHDRAVTRLAMAGTMWPEVSEERAGISLRSALSRLDPTTREAILVASAGLQLADTVSVDLHEAQALAHRLIHGAPLVHEDDLSNEAIAALSSELLPDWYDDWVVAEAEDWRQLRMNGLEALAQLLVDSGRLGEAAGAARAAMKVEPLRESAHASLIRVHLSQGNQSEALRVYERYEELLLVALDLEPTAHLSELVAGIRRT
jgi:DNA-binding SARP family transcriptional activator/DNA-binding HxlR family transcriptional regulator